MLLGHFGPVVWFLQFELYRSIQRASFWTCLVTWSITILNNNGLSVEPWRTPTLTLDSGPTSADKFLRDTFERRFEINKDYVKIFKNVFLYFSIRVLTVWMAHIALSSLVMSRQLSVTTVSVESLLVMTLSLEYEMLVQSHFCGYFLPVYCTLHSSLKLVSTQSSFQ